MHQAVVEDALLIRLARAGGEVLCVKADKLRHQSAAPGCAGWGRVAAVGVDASQLHCGVHLLQV